jgi:methylphosphotriester-DNA--protein-cysteine methyltransferase
MKKRSLLKALLAATLVCATATFAVEGGTAVKGNKSSKIYHKPACKHYAAKGSTVEFKSEAEAMKAGYKACKKCGKAKTEKKAKAPEKK